MPQNQQIFVFSLQMHKKLLQKCNIYEKTLFKVTKFQNAGIPRFFDILHVSHTWTGVFLRTFGFSAAMISAANGIVFADNNPSFRRKKAPFRSADRTEKRTFYGEYVSCSSLIASEKIRNRPIGGHAAQSAENRRAVLSRPPLLPACAKKRPKAAPFMPSCPPPAQSLCRCAAQTAHRFSPFAP